MQALVELSTLICPKLGRKLGRLKILSMFLRQAP
jgi:hypothetical protein